jgi:Rho family protein
VRSICGKAIPVILVACKTDLREKAIQNGTYTTDKYIDRETVSFGVPIFTAGAHRQGQKVAQSIGAKAYYETSALLNQGVDAVFEAATRAAVLVRDQGHGGVGAAYDKDGVKELRREKDSGGVGKCCVIA